MFIERHFLDPDLFLGGASDLYFKFLFPLLPVNSTFLFDNDYSLSDLSLDISPDFAS